MLSYARLAKIFFKTGMLSFGGWSTTSLLLTKELTSKNKILPLKQLEGAVAYAQVLPGATQVAIVANVGYKLRNIPGACLATICYLLPSVSLITLFAALYFHYALTDNVAEHLGGVTAALGGIILANAYRIGSKHATHNGLWLVAGLAFIASLWLHVNAAFIILASAVGGLMFSWFYRRGDLNG